jgi:signal transduction histidine kinase
LSPTVPAAERLRRTERVISFVRLAVVLFNVATYQLLSPGTGDRGGLADAVCVVAILYALITVFYKPSREQSLAVALASTVLDNFFIGLWIYATGGFASIGRFGVVLGNLTGLLGAGIYAAVVAIDGFDGVGYRLWVRLGYIFLIGAWVSYVVDSARRSEREVAEAERETAAYIELDRLRSTFVTNISHELRTPLTAIRGAAATLARKPGLTAKEESTLVEMLDRQSARLSELVQDIIDIGLVDQGRLVPRMDWCDIDVVVADVVEERRVGSGRRIDLSPPRGPVRVYCDGGKIGNAVAKVLDNALKFSPADSRVEVRIEEDQKMVTVSISDDGVGIDAEQMKQIFDRFHQADSSHTRRVGGTGIGLSIAKTVVELHGGTIDASSEPGRGSRFSIRFPKEPTDLQLQRLITDSQSVETADKGTEPHPG